MPIFAVRGALLRRIPSGPPKRLAARRISPETARGLEMLGHAIEYLADEFALECRTRALRPVGKDARAQALELLIARQREVFLACPVVPTRREKLQALLDAIARRLRPAHGA